MMTGELHWKTKQDHGNSIKAIKLYNNMPKAIFELMSNEKS